MLVTSKFNTSSVPVAESRTMHYNIIAKELPDQVVYSNSIAHLGAQVQQPTRIRQGYRIRVASVILKGSKPPDRARTTIDTRTAIPGKTAIRAVVTQPCDILTYSFR